MDKFFTDAEQALSDLQAEAHSHGNQATLDKLSDDGARLFFGGNPVSDGGGTSSPGASYRIRLEQWGITEGVPAKPYTDDHFLTANANVEGINQAIQYAYENGYQEILLPTGSYAICYPTPIRLRSGMTLNLNRSLLKVIYDSDRQNPLDPVDRSSSKDFYKFGGNTIELNNVENAHVRNGAIIGCKADRSFANPAEVAVEWTYGIVINEGSSYCSVRNCEVSYYMGDNLSISSSSPATYAEFSLDLTKNGIHNTTGNLMESSTSLTSKLIPLRKDSEGNNYSTLMVTGFGYTRQTALKERKVGFYFYRSDGSYIGGYPDRKIYTEVTIPNEAEQVRLVFYHETNTSASSTAFQISLNYGGIPHHNLFENNIIEYGHRGGVTLGGSYNIVQNNVIRNNGQGSTAFLSGNHRFNDPTRYSINQEDSYGDNCVIRHNLIQGSYHGVLIGCYTVLIEDNHFYNIDNIAINLYSLQYALIRNNYAYNCLVNIGLMTAHLTNAHVEVTENSFHGGSVKLDATGYQVSVTNNQFEDCTLILAGEDTVFQRNTIQFVNRDSNSTADLSIRGPISDCIFDAKANQKTVRFNQYLFSSPVRIEDCQFTNIHVQAQAAKTAMSGCTFTNSKIVNHTFSPQNKALQIDRSTITDTILQTGNINSPDALVSLQVSNSVINLNTLQDALRSEMNNPYITSTLALTDCTINVTNQFAYLYRSLSNGKARIQVKGCVLTASGTAPQGWRLCNNASHVDSFLFAENRLLNINPPSDTAVVTKWYDPERKTDGEPSEGYYFSGDVRYEYRPAPGKHAAWICVTEGEACQASWAPNTDYLIGERIVHDNRVYESVAAGRSVHSLPSFPSGSTGVLDEKSALPAWTPSTSYHVGDLVRPTGTLGYYMECTVSGTSGTSEPNWSTWQQVTDNTVTWIPRKSVVWKRIANKAGFAPYGLIE